jgi:hypothetical protein
VRLNLLSTIDAAQIREFALYDSRSNATVGAADREGRGSLPH